MNSKEKKRGCKSVCDVDAKFNQIALLRPDTSEISKNFAYDSVYDVDSNQQTVYNESAFSLVESVLEGYNGTIFAYGQTGCGKTHTMVGDYASEDLKGIIPKAFSHIFGYIDSIEDDTKFLVRCSYLEIYNEAILDLLGSDHNAKHDVKQDPDKGIYVQNLTNAIVKTVPEIEKIMNAGMKHRKVGETAMNDQSSRSHSIFTIYIERSCIVQGQQKIRAGKLHLVDLAGSERQSKTHAQGDRLKEAQKINLSLSALGNVISALVDGKSIHIPYRDSKLTRLLQDSLGGNTKTVMIAAVSPADYNYDETLSTLRYASRAKSIKNKPKINEDPKDALLREYESEIKQLKAALLELQKGGGGNSAALMKKMTESFKNAENSMVMGQSADAVINRIESGDVSYGQNGHDHNKMSDKMREIESMAKNKDAQLQKEQGQREQLELMLKEMEEKMVTGGDAIEEEKEKIKAKAFREYQLKLKKQKRKELKLLEDQKQKEEDLLMMEHEYIDLQTEVNEKTKVLKKLRKRYKAALAEIQDLESEHLNEKAELLESIRQLEVDCGFYKAITDNLLNDHNLYKIKAKSQYNDETSEWVIPPFILKGKQISLPKLGLQKAKKFVEEEKSQQIVDFKETPSPSFNLNNTQEDDYFNDGKGQDVARSAVYHRTNKKKSRDATRKRRIKNKNANKLKFQGSNAPTSYDDVDDVLNGPTQNDENNYDFGHEGSLHDYKERYNEDFKFTPDRAEPKRKPHFISQQPARNDYGDYGKNAASESKLPSSLRWALEDENNEDPVYERNPKVNTHLKPLRNPLGSQNYGDGGGVTSTAGTIYGNGTAHDSIGRIPSIKKLSSQKTRRLQPLRK